MFNGPNRDNRMRGGDKYRGTGPGKRCLWPLGLRGDIT